MSIRFIFEHDVVVDKRPRRTFTLLPGKGVKGDPGPGVPAGGALKQVLRKVSATDYDTEWADPEVTAEQFAALEEYVRDMSPVKTIGPAAIASVSDAAPLNADKVVVDIEPVQAGSGTPSPTNVRPITGWAAAQVARTGKNRLDLSGITPVKNENGLTITVNENGSIDITGTASSQAQIYWRIPSAIASGFAGMLLDCLPAAKSGLFVILEESGGSYTNFATNNSASGTVIRDDIATLTNYANFIIRISSGTAFPEKYTVCPMIRPVSSESGWVPYQLSTYSITFPSAAGTVYGGTLDVTAGKLTVDRAMVDMGTLEWHDAGYNYNIFYSLIADMAAATTYDDRKTGIMSSAYKISTSISLNQNMDDKSMLRADRNINVRNTAYSDATTFTAAMSGVHLVYELATPVTYDLTPQEIALLAGTNNVWSNTGDTTLSYRAAILNYIDQRINATRSMIAGIEAAMKATKAYSAGNLLIVGDTLYKATTSIANGATLTPGTNVTATTVAEQLILLANA